jgi:hypothetical protein
LFVKSDYLEKFPLLKDAQDSTSVSQLSIVHPETYLRAFDLKRIGLKKVLLALPVLMKTAILKRTYSKKK